ncbi:MAG: hypothetical protein NT122_04970 [Solirubrobacterales bacterium]|nr:hypothetical protein [Solirubrobacterales bacterium]
MNSLRNRLLTLLLASVSLLAAGMALTPSSEARFNPKKAIWGPSTINGKSAFPTYKRLGVGIYSIAIDWRLVARRRPKHPRDPRDPAYVWNDRVKDSIVEARLNGIRVNAEIIHAPAWANGGHSRNYAPLKASDYADFAVAAARRFPKVHMWMIWGEPSRRFQFMPYDAQDKSSMSKGLNARQARGPQKYAQLLDAAYGALKGLDASNLIIGGNTYTSGDIRANLWIRYMKLPNGNEFSDLGRLKDVVNNYLAVPNGKRAIPLFLSEWCIPTGPDKEFNYQVSEATQAKWINSAFRIVNADNSFIYALGWIHLQDSKNVSSGLLDASGREKLGFEAFMNG